MCSKSRHNMQKTIMLSGRARSVRAHKYPRPAVQSVGPSGIEENFVIEQFARRNYIHLPTSAFQLGSEYHQHALRDPRLPTISYDTTNRNLVTI